MKSWFVVNPHAGRARSGDPAAAIRRRLGARAATISSAVPGAGARPPLVVAVGGDGTINRVINGCDLSWLRIGILPCGSANDLSAELAIPGDLARAWDVLDAGRCEQVDLISVNGARFATCGGFGLPADVALRANRWKAGTTGESVRRLGPLVYVLAALAELRKPQRGIAASVRAEGVTRRLRLGGALVSNQPRFGRWFSASPDASNRDGLLDFCGVLPGSRARMLRIFGGMLGGGGEVGPDIVRLRSRALTVETDAPVTFFGDGEPLAEGRHFRIELEPRALTVVSGRNASALAEAA